MRLFVVAAACLSIHDTISLEKPAESHFSDFIRKFADSEANFTHYEMGSIMLKAALERIEQEGFKESLKALAES